VIEATPGGSTANSYVTIEAAEAYFAGRVGAEAWMNATADQKERALITAARGLERLRWPGVKSNAGQALSWPRIGAHGVEDDAIPTAIRDAQCEEALALLTPEVVRRRQLRAAGVTDVGLNDVRERYAPVGAEGLLSAEARALLMGWVALGGCLVSDRIS